MVLGLLTTFLIPETARKTLEELSGEEEYSQPAPASQPDIEGGRENVSEEGLKEVTNVSTVLNT